MTVVKLSAIPNKIKRPAAFRQVDVTRAVRGAAAAGMAISRVEIGPDGKIVLTSGVSQAPGNDFDSWKARDNARSS